MICTDKPIPEGLLWGWKSVHADLRTRDNFQWPLPGEWVRSDHAVDPANSGACPKRPGDGVCIAHTFAGAASGGIRLGTALIVGYHVQDVLGADNDKVRVRCAWVWALDDVIRLIIDSRAYLAGANLAPRLPDPRRPQWKVTETGALVQS
jgi:hypothetical protein